MTALGPPIALAFAGLALLLIAVAFYAYVGYPLVVRLLPKRTPAPRPAASPREWPRVSVLIAARNEAAVIRARIENVLRQDYPADRLEVLIVSDASDDGTDEIVMAFDDPRVRLLRQEPRGGKTAGINRLATLATGEIFVQTDANVLFAPGTVRALVRAFDDPGIGLAIGEVVFTNSDDPGVAQGEGLYWRFETATKLAEAERGLLCVSNGGVYAIHRTLWRPLPPTLAGDAMEPLLVLRDGKRIAFAHEAKAFERASSTLGEEFARKVRIISRQVACARWIGLSSLPLRTLWTYASHKLLRYLVPFLLVGAFGAALASAWLGFPLAIALAASIALPFVLAPLGLLALGGVLGKLGRVALYFSMINLASILGLARGLKGAANVTWEVPASTRGVETVSPEAPQVERRRLSR